MNLAESRAYQQATSGMTKGVIPILRRHAMHNTADRLELMITKLRGIIPTLRDVELLEATGCCCGEIRGMRTNRPLCEACEQRAGNGGSY